MKAAMGMGGDGEVEVERPPFRWLDVARYAAASMVTVLIAVAVLKAIKVLLFPDALYVSVVHGSISATPILLVQPPRLQMDLILRIDNPKRRAIMYYVTAYLFDNDTPASSSNPEYDSIAYFDQSDTVVFQRMEVRYGILLRMNKNQIDPVFFDLLYNNSGRASVSGVTMRMDATLIVTDTDKSRNSNTSRPVTYYCWPLVIQPRSFVAAAEDLGDDDVFCRESQGNHRFI